MRNPYAPGWFSLWLHTGFLLAVLIGIALIVWLVVTRKKKFPGRPGWGPQHAWGVGPWGPGPGPHAGPPAPPVPFDALRILDERLAKGEIDVDDYLSRKSALVGEGPNGHVFSPGPAPEPPPAPEPQAPPPPPADPPAEPKPPRSRRSSGT